MKQTEFSPEELALDAGFQQWVLERDKKQEEKWVKWAAASPGRQQIANEARDFVLAAGLVADNELNLKYLDAWHQINKNIQVESPPELVKVQTSYTWYWFAAAAVVILMVAGVSVFYSFQNNQLSVIAAFGETKNIELPDGSLVTLNADSKVRYASNFGEEEKREVYLEGEAFFEVTKSADSKPFVVYAGEGVEVEVLGTKFNLKTRQRKTELYLQEGAVLMSSGYGKVQIAPGQISYFDAERKRYEVSEQAAADEAMILDWVEKMFVFNNISLSAIAEELEQAFGVKVVVKEPALLDKKVTAKVPRDDLFLVTQVLSEALQVDIAIKESELVISPR